MEQGGSEQLSSSDMSSTIESSPSPMASVPSSKQGASGSSGHTTILSQMSDYHQVDGTAVGKEPEQEQLSTPAIDTLSDIIATMEEDTSPSAVEQALHEAYIPDISCDSLAPLTSSSTSATLPHSNEAGYVQPQETKAASNFQPHIQLGVSSSNTLPGDLSSEPPLEDWLALQHTTNSSDVYNFKASEAGADCSSHDMETEDIAQEWYGNSVLQSEEDIPTCISTEGYCHTSTEQNGYVHHADGVNFILKKEH